MHDDRTMLLASLIVVGTGTLWGFYWLTVRRLAEGALPGAWGTLAIVAAAALLMAPAALGRRGALAEAHPLALASVALGGAAFALYSVGFVYGRVAIIILLFFLTPVWSTLIARYVMGGRPRACASRASPSVLRVSPSCLTQTASCRCRAAQESGLP